MRRAVTERDHQHEPAPLDSRGVSPSQIRRPGVTPPSRRGGSGRRLDDVIVDLGFVDRDEMDAAIAEAERSGSSAERVLLARGQHRPRTSSRAPSPSASGSTTSTCAHYRFDPNAAKLVTPAAVKRYKAIPVSFVNDRTLLVAMADPAQRARRRRHRRHDRLRGAPGRRRRRRHRSARSTASSEMAQGERRSSRRLAPSRRTPPRPPPPAHRRRHGRGPLYDLSELRVRAQRRTRTPRSSGSCTASSPRPSTAAPPTSTSSPTRRR